MPGPVVASAHSCKRPERYDAWPPCSLKQHGYCRSFWVLALRGVMAFFEARPRLRRPKVQLFLTCACMPQAPTSKAKLKFPSANPLRGGGNPHAIGPGSLVSTEPSEYKHRTANATTGKSIGGISPSQSCWTLRLDEYQPPPTVYFDDPEQWSFGLEWSSSGALVER